MTGEYGGAVFVLFYLLFLVLMGIPVMTMELAVGRASRKKRSQGLRRAGETGLEVAYPWMVLRPWLLPAHDVLYDGIRLDACLF